MHKSNDIKLDTAKKRLQLAITRLEGALQGYTTRYSDALQKIDDLKRKNKELINELETLLRFQERLLGTQANKNAELQLVINEEMANKKAKIAKKPENSAKAQPAIAEEKNQELSPKATIMFFNDNDDKNNSANSENSQINADSGADSGADNEGAAPIEASGLAEAAISIQSFKAIASRKVT